MTSRQGALSRLQAQVAAVFFSLPEARGYLLAGGAGLLAHRLISRPTQDLDLFTHRPHIVTAALHALEDASEGHGWSVTRLQVEDSFARLKLHHNDGDLLIDLAVDSPASMPATLTFVGPTFAPRELAARKLLALFDRAEARDFADVYQLLQTYDRDELLALASTIDPGFHPGVFAYMLRSHVRFPGQRIPLPHEDLEAARRLFDTWADHLDNGRT